MKRNSQRKETESNGIFSGTYSNSHDNLIASPKNENIIAILLLLLLLPQLFHSASFHNLSYNLKLHSSVVQ